MTNQIRNPNDKTVIVRFLVLGGVSLAAMGACWWAAGPSLGLFFGGLFVATFLVPAAVLTPRLGKSFAGLFVVVVPVAAVWLITILRTSNTPAQWAQSVLVLLTYSLAVAGAALAIRRLRIPAVFAAAAAIFLALAWLTWPVWLAPSLVTGGHDGVVQSLVAAHPPLTINGILVGEPAWTERSIAYHLTDLNQDVPIRLPSNAAVCSAVHGGLALALWFAAWAGRKNNRDAVLNSPPSPHTLGPNVASL